MAVQNTSLAALLLRIENSLPNLSKSERKVAEYIRGNPRGIIDLSVAALADACGVSDPTVVRAYKKLGFSGYEDLKLTLAQATVSPDEIIHEEISAEDSVQAVRDKVFQSAVLALQFTRDMLEPETLAAAAQLLMNARKIVIFGLGGIGCIAASDAFLPGLITETMIGDTVATAAEGMTYTFTTGASMATTVLEITGNVLTLVACGFGAMIAAGASRLSASKKLRLLADAAEGMDYRKGLPVEMLADLTHQKKAKTLKKLRRYIQKDWLAAWLDEKTEKLYLTAEDYRAAKEAAAAPAPQPKPEQPEAEAVPLNLDTARRFVQVLEKEQQLMQDPQAREELEQMQKTAAAICDWLEAHPESLPKARRFAEYYIPTTLKLLHTYNDVQGQQGANAESIRRDIAGILHTLNQAFDNLYDNLLSDVAMDVSSEIAALQGMLANDGLTGRDFQ